MTELINKFICNSLSHHVNENQKDWSLYYKMVIFVYNTCPSLRLKFSPFYLLHGIEANQPLELDDKLTIDNELCNLTKSLKQLQTIRNTMYKGLFTFIEKLTDVNYKVELILRGKKKSMSYTCKE
ncbi:hypothetical protein QTP88_024130 [Uroleucon formosanum]